MSLFWLFGQSISIVALATGAVLSFFAREPYLNGREERRNTADHRLKAHAPLNHRLLLEAEW